MARHQHDIQMPKIMLAVSKGLACQTLQPVSIDRSTRLFLRDRKSQAAGAGCLALGE